jgi:hypothetical protein
LTASSVPGTPAPQPVGTFAPDGVHLVRCFFFESLPHEQIVSGLPWFRMYAEAVDDDKLRLLAFEDRWHFVALLCLKAQGILDERNDVLRRQKIGVKLGLDSVELETAMKRLVTVGLVTSKWQPANWRERQFLSDSSTPRVQKHRERYRNVPVTPSDTDTDTDTDTEREKKPRTKRASRAPEDFKPDLEYAKAQLPDIDAERESQKFRDWEFKTPRSDWPATWRNWIQRCRETKQYAKAGAGGTRWM